MAPPHPLTLQNVVYPPDQELAARAALDKASLLVLSYHLDRCLTAPTGPQSRAQLERVIQFFLRFSNAVPEPQVPGESQAESSA